MNIVVLGPQASGKGTQSKLIAEKYNIPHISTGQILRDMISTNSVHSEYIKSYMYNGILVPDEFIIKLLKERIGKKDCKKGFVLDGFPRNIYQVKLLDDIIKIDIAILIDLDRKEIMRRLLGRRVCEKCGFSTHVDYLKGSSTCEKCGCKLIVRDDETEESIKRRLHIYDTDTKDVLEHYSKQNKLARVDGQGDIKEVFNRIDLLLGGVL